MLSQAAECCAVLLYRIDRGEPTSCADSDGNRLR
jgi:hypothetical protein